ncbi:hypothetical protein ASPWEDRAFT_118843 [Aspergillus wentii DTO 134E9]|uniref:Zn(2)-C6 fungal-type domain-containing protein n=1 Tax=Aspergillus wentii DTO 134E9 TaxID=1073089 RepID=A0A1L9R840_ASPWE|nr:uncharacterized protein ASPWEDRAFT_118843 [Aspergillus wentii DTO 134E9]OJJ31090.1 hypothetical protein ASPWEDRAFT_118843 [Aspergillus wentii DTO 134E9]
MPTYPIRRRPRECKTCLPCRASKVRCDRNVPCGNCVKRNFDCSYGRPPPKPPSSLLPDRSNTAATTPQQPLYSSSSFPTSPYAPSFRNQPDNHDVSYNFDSAAATLDSEGQDPPSDTVTISQGEWDDINTKMSAMEHILASLHSIFQTHSAQKPRDPFPEDSPNKDHTPQSEGIYEPNSLKTGAVHIGSRSALVDIIDKSKDSEETAQALPKDDILAELALGNESAAYPFVDLWSSDPFTFNIAGVCAVLPDDEKCHKFLDFYKDIGAVLYPVLSDTDGLEHNMKRLLRGRVHAGGVYRPDANGLVKPFGMSLGFLSLLFAVLASGCQLSNLTSRERELTSWVYVSCSYQCLRMMNYVSQPTVEVIQILLIISNVLSYNMNAGSSYTLLGMTERMCMVLGLHVESSGFPPFHQAVRRRVWWAMAFQNSHFSLAYDRPSITMVSQPEIPFDPKSMPGYRSYFETLCRIVYLALEVMRGRMASNHTHLRYHEIREYKQRMQRILAEATPHLRYRERCLTLAEHIERMELRLHSSYLLSVLCRVSLDPDSHLDDHRRAIVRDDCITNLLNTIEAFVELHSINPHCSRSWISLQRTIASAFLLVTNDDGQRRPLTWELIGKLETVLSDHVYADGALDQNSRTDSAKHLASSLRALREVSAAFHASSKPGLEALSAVPKLSPTTVLPSPASMKTSPVATAMAGQVLPTDDSSMRNMLGHVSEVMMFPSMGIGEQQ